MIFGHSREFKPGLCCQTYALFCVTVGFAFSRSMMRCVSNVHIEADIVFGQNKTTSGKVGQLTIVVGSNSPPQKQSVSRFCCDAKRTFEFTEIQN